MKKIHVGLLAVFAVFALTAVVVPSASASGELLAGGGKITAKLSIAVTGELLLEDDKASVLGNPDLLCSGIGNGSVEAGGVLGFGEGLLMLNGELLEGPSGEDMVDCTDMNSLCSKGEAEKVLLNVLNAPWHVEIELFAVVGGVSLYRAVGLRETGKIPAYEIVCETSLGTLKDVCETEEGTTTDALLENTSEGLLSETKETETESGSGITLPGKCSLGGAQSGLVQGDGFVTETGTAKEALTVSE